MKAAEKVHAVESRVNRSIPHGTDLRIRGHAAVHPSAIGRGAGRANIIERDDSARKTRIIDRDDSTRRAHVINGDYRSGWIASGKRLAGASLRTERILVPGDRIQRKPDAALRTNLLEVRRRSRLQARVAQA
jgi:hypothetical protein